MVKPTINYQSDFALQHFPLSEAQSEIKNWLDGNTGTVCILEDGKAKKVSLNFTRAGDYAVNKQIVKKLIVLFSVDSPGHKV
jgi:hypothetical protein